MAETPNEKGHKLRVAALKAKHGGKLPESLAAVNSDIGALIKKTEKLSHKPGLAQFVSHYVELKRFHESLDELKTILSIERDRMAYELIPQAFESEGATTITLKEGYRVTVTPLVRASTMPDKREDAKKWLIDNGHGELITETINASTLTAFAKSLLEEGHELPEELFKVHIGKNTSVTKVS